MRSAAIVQRGLRTPTGPFFARLFIGIILGLVAEFAFMGQSTRLAVLFFAARWMDRKQIGDLRCQPGCSTGRHVRDSKLLAAQRFVSIDALTALSALLDLALKDQTPSAVLLSGASRASHDQNQGESHVAADGNARERIPKQSTAAATAADGSVGSGLSNGMMGARAWPELPAEARATLMSLMKQLILDHAATTATPLAKEVSHDLWQGQASSPGSQGDSLRASILSPSGAAQSREYALQYAMRDRLTALGW